jgi:ABC-type multidrug transport system ATPase subunit
MVALHADSLSFSVSSKSGKQKTLIDNVSLELPEGSFTCVVGPSGCGKSTLLNLLAGIAAPTSGKVLLAGYEVSLLKDELPLTIGFLPQFASFHEELSVLEVLQYGLELRMPKSVSQDSKRQWLEKTIELTGISSVINQSPATLSGGQLRRLALAEQLLGDPPFLFLDELTSGLDPHSEREIMWWLSDLVKKTNKTVVLVTHSLANLEASDHVVFLNKGQLIYSGEPSQILSYFDAPDMEHIYANADSYSAYAYDCEQPSEPTSLQTARPPRAFSQLVTLLKRQSALFFRDKGQLILHGLLLITFPFLVAVFAYKGIPEVRELSTELQTNIVKDLADKLAYLKNSFGLASLVSGVSMFQVILLALIGANNGAREIAKERDILTKELRVGLNPLSYLISKFLFIGVLSLLQSFWMTFFVRAVCDFPGDFTSQFILLFLVTFAMSSTCLWFSSISKTPERASLLAIYSVGLQLPLSGAVLALPEIMTFITRPFIASYWGWSGYLRTFHDYRHYDIVAESTKTEIASYGACAAVLFLHVAITFILTWWALNKRAKLS